LSVRLSTTKPSVFAVFCATPARFPPYSRIAASEDDLSSQRFGRRHRTCITCNMAAPRQDAVTIHELELEIDQLLEEQVESLGRPLLSITSDEAVQFAAGRDKLTALLEQLARLRASNASHPTDGLFPK